MDTPVQVQSQQDGRNKVKYLCGMCTATIVMFGLTKQRRQVFLSGGTTDYNQQRCNTFSPKFSNLLYEILQYVNIFV
jgi:hypothetical protein